MNRYDANDLKSKLAGAQTLQSLSGGRDEGILASVQADLGADSVAPSPAMDLPAPQIAANAAWNPVLKGLDA